MLFRLLPLQSQALNWSLCDVIRRYNISDADKLIRLCALHWDKISDDSSPENIIGHVHETLSNDRVFVIGDDPRSMSVVFYPLSSNIVQTHIVFDSMEKDKRNRARAAVGWMFENTEFSCITAFCYSKETMIFASMCGMKRVGVLPKSFKKNGLLLDQTIYQCVHEDYKEVSKWQQR